MTLAARLWNMETVTVRTPAGVVFTIKPRFDRHGFRVRGFGIIPAGRKRPVRSPILSRLEVENWADDLQEA